MGGTQLVKKASECTIRILLGRGSEVAEGVDAISSQINSTQKENGMKLLSQVEAQAVGGAGFFMAVGHAIGYCVGYAAHEMEMAATSPEGSAAISAAYTSGAAV